MQYNATAPCGAMQKEWQENKTLFERNFNFKFLNF